jgi:uncharacterized protein YjbJ (UPF0337 family)
LNKRSDGEANKVKGSIKEAIGKIIGSPEIENVGSAEKVKGHKQAAKSKGRSGEARGSTTDRAALSKDEPTK